MVDGTHDNRASTRNVLMALVADIRRTSEPVAENSAACREQSVGIEQTNRAIRQLDRVTQLHAGAANQMSAMAGRLADRAGCFRPDRSARRGGYGPGAARGGRALQETVQRFDAAHGGRRLAPAVPVAASASRPARGGGGVDRMLDSGSVGRTSA